MKVRRLDPRTEPVGYCQDCHRGAVIEITFGNRASLKLCRRDARFMIKHVDTELGPNGNGNGKKRN